MKKILEFISDYSWVVWVASTVVAFYLVASGGYLNGKPNEPLKDYKDGIQNHLAWDIKGQCFFVRPNDDVTVYLIRVTDCDKK